MSIIINRNIFLDSLQFCKETLDKFASNLNNEDFKHLMSAFPPNKLEILKRKDSYPYEWVDSYKKFMKNYALKNVFIHQQMMVKEVKVMVIFLMNNVYT